MSSTLHSLLSTLEQESTFPSHGASEYAALPLAAAARAVAQMQVALEAVVQQLEAVTAGPEDLRRGGLCLTQWLEQGCVPVTDWCGLDAQAATTGSVSASASGSTQSTVTAREAAEAAGLAASAGAGALCPTRSLLGITAGVTVLVGQPRRGSIYGQEGRSLALAALAPSLAVLMDTCLRQHHFPAFEVLLRAVVSALEMAGTEADNLKSLPYIQAVTSAVMSLWYQHAREHQVEVEEPELGTVTIAANPVLMKFSFFAMELAIDVSDWNREVVDMVSSYSVQPEVKQLFFQRIAVLKGPEVVACTFNLSSSCQ